MSPKEENYNRAIVDEPITYDHMNSESMKAYLTASPWNLVQDFEYEMNNVPLNVWIGDEGVERSKWRVLTSSLKVNKSKNEKMLSINLTLWFVYLYIFIT